MDRMGHHVLNLKRYSSSETLAIAAANQEIRVFCNDKPPSVYYLNKLGVENDFRQSAPLYFGEFHRAVPEFEALLEASAQIGSIDTDVSSGTAKKIPQA